MPVRLADAEAAALLARAIRGDVREIAPVATLADGVKVKIVRQTIVQVMNKTEPAAS